MRLYASLPMPIVVAYGVIPMNDIIYVMLMICIYVLPLIAGIVIIIRDEYSRNKEPISNVCNDKNRVNKK